jgi:flagellar basal body P-ring formation protein FlgA
MLRFVRLPAALAMALFAAWAMAQTADPVVVVLRTEATVSGKLVKIGDIARIDGGSASLREAFAKLDIGEWQGSADRLVVSRNDVKFRLLIRGFEERSFVVAGPPRCVVGRRSSPLSEEAARQALQQAVAERAPELAKFLVAHLEGALKFPPLRIEDSDRVRLEGKLLDQGLPLGRTRGQILVLVNGEQKAVVPASLDVTFAQSAQALQKPQAPEKSGPLIPSRSRPGPLGPLGAIADAQANAGEVDLPNALLVRARDRVQMVAIVGHVCATMPGEALQDGRLGQTINVRNVDSSKTVSGRVTGRGTVEIERRTGTQP